MNSLPRHHLAHEHSGGRTALEEGSRPETIIRFQTRRPSYGQVFANIRPCDRRCHPGSALARPAAPGNRRQSIQKGP